MIYQEEQDIQEKQPENASFATISQVFEDGVTLRFGQEDTPSQKRYRVNSFAVFHAGTECFWRKTRYLCGVVSRWQTKVEFSGGHSDAGGHCRHGIAGSFGILCRERG